MSMGAGALNQRITFQARAAGQDAMGSPNGAWANVATNPTVWAKSANVSSRDIAAVGLHQAGLDAKFVVRWRADVLPTWRVLWRGVAYAIVGEPAALAGGTEWLEIRCTKSLGAG
jgi:SPP1 family predicted phage head-tail adaptor